MFELIPDRPGLAGDEECTVDLLVRIKPPALEGVSERPGLNLTLVLDRSGSMAGTKLDLTRQAAGLAVRSLAETDRFGVVLFDDRVDTLIPSALLRDKPKALELIGGVAAGGSTALFAGWQTGGEQALRGVEPRRINRVVLLTDGQANVGETNPDTICHAVHQLAERGVQTTTIGFGSDYNENLLRSIASSGDGNHFFVERPEQLTTCFEVELGGLTATLGRRVRLEVVPRAPGVVVEPLGTMESHPDGGFKLADLVADWPMEQVFRITAPASTEGQPPVAVVLSWESVQDNRACRQEVPLALPVMTKAERAALAVSPEVEQQVGLAMAARARLEAMDVMRKGDRDAATRILRTALTSYNLPPQQKAELEDLARTAERGDTSSTLKKGTAQSYSYSRGSVSLSGLGGIMTLLKLIGSSTLPILRAPIFVSGDPRDPRPWPRAEGMLAGLLHGERAGRSSRGEAAVLTAVTLDNIGPDTGLDPSMMLNSMFEPRDLAGLFVKAPVGEPGDGLLGLRQRFLPGSPNSWFPEGRAGCGGLQRVAPFLVPHMAAPAGPAVWVDVTFGTALTHNDTAAHAASLGFARLLWELAGQASPPGPGFYLEQFLTACDGLEPDKPYTCRSGRMDGWTGKLSDFVRQAVEQARAEKQPAEQALESWGHGAYLMEVVPGLLYLLECHGHEPARALELAPPGGWMGALVGAALGALHGRQPSWSLEPDQEELLERTRRRFFP